MATEKEGDDLSSGNKAKGGHFPRPENDRPASAEVLSVPVFQHELNSPRQNHITMPHAARSVARL